MTMPYRVLAVQIFFRKNIEDCIEAIQLIKKHIVRDVSDAKHTNRTLCYVMPTSESPESLMKRYADFVVHPDIEDVLIFPLHPPFVGKSAFANFVTSKAEIAWKRVRENREAQEIQKAKRSLINNKKSNLGKSIVGRSGPGKFSKKSNKPNFGHLRSRSKNHNSQTMES